MRFSHFIFLFVLLYNFSALAQTHPTREFPKTDFDTSSIPFSEVFSGGVSRDAIPAIDNPRFVHHSDGDLDLGEEEPVLSLRVGGEARAYPLRILIWHEIVNDTLGGKKIAVTFCPLCNSAIIFDRSAGGKVLDFGTTGRLRNSDLLMYDRQTESWWQQVTGTALIGSLTGTKLKVIPSRLEAWKAFKKRNPEGAVLVPSNPNARPYGRNPYAEYDGSPRPFLYSGELPKNVPALERVLSLEDRKKAWSFSLLRKKKTIKLNDDIMIIWEKGQNSALDDSSIREGKDVGTAYAVKKIGGEWVDIPYFVEFAFAFHAFFPESPILD
jgi:hypothetical protein